MGDVLLLQEGSLEIVHVLSRGVFVVRGGTVVNRENWLHESDRRVRLDGDRAAADDSPGDENDDRTGDGA